MKKIIPALLILIFASACKKQTHNIQFYHWKSNAVLSPTEKEALTLARTQKTYIHYFDVVLTNTIPHPVAVVQNIDTFFNKKEVIPVVFIANSVFKNNHTSTEKLAEKVEKLVHQIHKRYFNKSAKKIQIDCDWTKSTKEQYFKFLKLLNKKLTLSATIRLHQIKYQTETGIPPVNHGVLMLYNVGDLSNFEHNSILNSTIIQQYIHKKSNYPLLLNLALPLFSQVVIKNNENNIRLINTVIEDDFKKDTVHFEKINKTTYRVLKKKLYKGHYLYKGFLLKLEKTPIEEIKKCNDLIKNSSLNIQNTILYHLDENEIKQQNFKKLITIL